MFKSNNQARKIYFDYASGAYPNPGSLHSEGVKARKIIEESRRIVAQILSARPEEIIFTSGGTEGNNLAIQGVISSFVSKAHSSINFGKKFLPHIITTNIEHSSVLETCKMLEGRGLAEITIVSVGASGIVDTKKIKEAILENTVLVSVMYANNEIGAIQPIKEIAKEIRHYKKTKNTSLPFFHTDAVQAVGYLDLGVERLGVDMLTLSGTKMIGVGAGVGILYKKKRVSILPIFGGGDQEHGLRPGTENKTLIENFANSIEVLQRKREVESERLSALRNFFVAELSKIEEGVILNGALDDRLPNNVNVTFPKIPSEIIVLELSANGIYVSEKSACKSGSEKNSHVILAIREASLSDQDASSVRFSFGYNTKKKDLVYTLKVLSKILSKLKKWYH